MSDEKRYFEDIELQDGEEITEETIEELSNGKGEE